MTRTMAPPLPRRHRSGHAPATVFEAMLTELSTRRATGSLHGTAGTVHLLDGAVVDARSPAAPDVGELLTGCGRLSAEDWEECLRCGKDRVGEQLVGSHLVNVGELELCRLTALLDAAYFALAQNDGGLHFTGEVTPPFAPTRPMSVPALYSAVHRRRALLDRVCPWPGLDSEAVRPRREPVSAGRRPVGSRRRRAVLAAADGRRTPSEIARLLGRSVFGTLLDLRHLAAAGLVETPAQRAGPAPAGVPAERRPPPFDPSDPEVALLLRLRAALELRL